MSDIYIEMNMIRSLEEIGEIHMKADNLSFLEFIGAGKRTFYIPVY